MADIDEQLTSFHSAIDFPLPNDGGYSFHGGSSAWSYIDVQLGSFRTAMTRFSVSLDFPLPEGEIDEKINAISDWVKEQKKSSARKGVQDRINNVGKVITSTVNAIEKFQSEDPFQILSGTLDIISSTSPLVGAPCGPVVAAVCSVIGVILSAYQPNKGSVVQQLAEVVHSELVNFNEKLQDQKFTGLNDRIKRQIHLLREMERPGDLKDPETLWEDYTQFLGEVSYRFESPIPFNYNDNLTKDADVADVVTALVTYCNAYTCLMTLLIAARGKFGGLGDSKSNEMIKKIDVELRFHESNAKEKLAFLSDGRYLTFLGRLPSEGGKLTKIVALARSSKARRQVEEVRRSLNLPAMANLATVDTAGKKVSRQSVRLKLEGHPVFWTSKWMQVINETTFPIKIVSGTVGWPMLRLKFEQDVQPRSSYEVDISLFPNFSTAGYLIVYCDGAIIPVDELSGEEQIVEFALSCPVFHFEKINVANINEFTRGSTTYNDMHSGETKTVYWVQRGVHYMARADILGPNINPFIWVPKGNGRGAKHMWRFVVQNFDPAQDVVDG